MTRERALIGALLVSAVAIVALLTVLLWPSSKAGGTIYVAANGNDSGGCTSASSPCRTFSYAYKQGAGKTVVVKGGNYPTQSIPSVSGRGSGDLVSFVTDGTVYIGCGSTSTVGGGTINGQTCLQVYGNWVSFDGGQNLDFRTPTYRVDSFDYQGRIDTERGATNITFKHMDVGAFAIGSSNTLISHNDVGPSTDPLNNRMAAGSGNTWSDNLIHDFVIKNGGHFECTTWDAGTSQVVEYNEFRSCDVFAIFAKPGDNISGKVDNNAFWNPKGLTTQQDLKITTGSGASQCQVDVTSNWFSEGTLFDCPGVSQSDNTTHPPSAKPPTPIRPDGSLSPTTTTPPSTSTGTTTGTTTTTPPTTTTAPPVYAPKCATTCDEQIAELEAELKAWETWHADAPNK